MSMWRQESLEKPFEREVLILTKKSGVDIMKAFKKDGKMVKVTAWSSDVQNASIWCI